MRYKQIGAAVLALAAIAAAPQRPRVSPHETHEFTLDGSRMTIEYGRPSKRGRDIWGALVPWGRWWMPGADEATILTTADPIVLGGALTVPKGEHTLYMLPDANRSQLIVNNEVGQFHTRYTARMDLGRVDFQMRKISPAVEQMTYEIMPRPEGGGRLTLSWDDREYSVTLEIRK